MLTLNRKSAVYQHLFNDAMTRLKRVPVELLTPFDEPNPKFAATLAPYIFEREEWETQVVREGSRDEKNTTFGEYFAPRITQNQASGYDRTPANYFSTPIECSFGGNVLASLMWLVFSQNAHTVIPFDLRAAAHRAVIVFAHGLVSNLTLRDHFDDTSKFKTTFFSARTEEARRGMLIAKLLNRDDVEIIGKLVNDYNRNTGESTRAYERMSRTIAVRYPIQRAQPGTRDQKPFRQFPFSYVEFFDVGMEFIDQTMAHYAATPQGERFAADDVVGDAETVLKEFRVLCYQKWLEMDELSPSIVRAVVMAELSKHLFFLVDTYRRENEEMLNFEF